MDPGCIVLSHTTAGLIASGHSPHSILHFLCGVLLQLVFHPPSIGILALLDLNSQSFMDLLNLLLASRSETHLFVIKEDLYVTSNPGFYLGVSV